MSAGIVDALEIVHIKEQHIGRVQINAGEEQVIPGAVVRSCQLVMRHFEVQMRQAVLVYLIHFVVRAGKVAELVRPDLRDRAVRLDALHRVQNRVDAKARCQPHHEENADRQYMAVLAAEIISKYAYLQYFASMSKSLKMKLVRGNSSSADQVAAAIAEKYGEKILTKVAKLNFTNTKRVKAMLNGN